MKLTIGRAPGNVISLIGDKLVSRKHGLAYSTPGGRIILEDVGSTNGTWANSSRVSAPNCQGQVVLAPGCIVSFGGENRNAFRVVASARSREPIDREPVNRQEILLPDDAAVEGAEDAGKTLLPGEDINGLLVFLRKKLVGRLDPKAGPLSFGGAEAQKSAELPAGYKIVGLPISALGADAWRIKRTSGETVCVNVIDPGCALLLNRGAVTGKSELRAGDVIQLAGFSELEMIYCDAPSRQVRSLRDFDLGDGRDVVVGRDAGCAIRLAHPTVSRFHARLRMRDGQVIVESLVDANPVRINGKGLAPGREVALNLGDELEFGLLRYSLDHTPGKKDLELPNEIDLILDRVTSALQNENGFPVVRGVSTVVESGEFVGCYGPSGCGKSTLFGLVRGTIPLAGGSVLLNGRRVQRQRKRWKNLFHDLVGSFLADASESETLVLVPQFDRHFENLTVRQTLQHYATLSLKNLTSDEREKRVEETLDDVVLRHKQDSLVTKLAGGEAKRLSVGTRLLRRPRLILLDEPEAGLDVGTCEELVTTFATLPQRGTTVMMITHHPTPFLRFRKVLFMLAGRLIYYGPPREMLPYFGARDLGAVFQRFQRPNYFDIRELADQAADEFEASPLFRCLIGPRIS